MARFVCGGAHLFGLLQTERPTGRSLRPRTATFAKLGGSQPEPPARSFQGKTSLLTLGLGREVEADRQSGRPVTEALWRGRGLGGGREGLVGVQGREGAGRLGERRARGGLAAAPASAGT